MKAVGYTKITGRSTPPRLCSISRPQKPDPKGRATFASAVKAIFGPTRSITRSRKRAAAAGGRDQNPGLRTPPAWVDAVGPEVTLFKAWR